MYICFLSCKFILLKWYICNSVAKCHYPLEVAFIWLILMITFPSSNHCIYISLGWLCWKESSLVSVHCLRRLQKCHYLWLLSYIISSGSSSCCLTHILYLTNFPVDLMPCFTFFYIRLDCLFRLWEVFPRCLTVRSAAMLHTYLCKSLLKFLSTILMQSWPKD